MASLLSMLCSLEESVVVLCSLDGCVVMVAIVGGSPSLSLSGVMVSTLGVVSGGKRRDMASATLLSSDLTCCMMNAYSPSSSIHRQYLPCAECVVPLCIQLRSLWSVCQVNSRPRR